MASEVCQKRVFSTCNKYFVRVQNMTNRLRFLRRETHFVRVQNVFPHVQNLTNRLPFFVALAPNSLCQAYLLCIIIGDLDR